MALHGRSHNDDDDDLASSSDDEQQEYVSDGRRNSIGPFIANNGSASHDNAADVATMDDASRSTLHVAEHDLVRTRRKFAHTTEAQRRCIVEWLEQPPNYQLLARGAAPVLSARGKRLKKTDGLRSLMRHVNAETDAQWDFETTRSRFESLMVAFRKTRQLVARADFGVTDNDRARGVADAQAKRDALFRFYDRFAALAATIPTASDAEFVMAPPTASVAMALEPVGSSSNNDSASVSTATVEPVSVDVVADYSAAVAKPKQKRFKRRHVSDVSSSRAEPVAIAPATTAVGASPSTGSIAATSTFEATVPASAPASAPSAAKAVSAELPAAAAAATTSSSSSADSVRLKELEAETQRLALQHEQLQLQKRELALKERELAAHEASSKHARRAELTGALVAAGKSVSEIREYLALLDG